MRMILGQGMVEARARTASGSARSLPDDLEMPETPNLDQLVLLEIGLVLREVPFDGCDRGEDIP